MKKTFLLLISFGTIFSVNAQYQSIFGQNSTSWSYWSDAPARNPAYIYTLYSNDRDTLINNKSYKIIFSSLGFVDHFLREDTVTGSVFAFDGGVNINEVQIMNMNLSVSDSFCLDPLYFCIKAVVDSVYTDTAGRKIIQFDTYNHPHSVWKFIEGIGPNGQVRLKDGLANPIEDLVCSHKDNIRVFMNDYGETCPGFFVGLKENSFGLKRIYPNPAKELIHLDFNSHGLTHFKLINPNGTAVLKGQFKSKTSINIQHLPQGLYIIELTNGGNRFYQKMIKQ